MGLAPGARVRVLILVSLLAVAACSKSPVEPGAAGSASTVQGQAVNVFDAAPIGGVSVQIGRSPAVTTDASGAFTVDVGSAGTYATTLRRSEFVERETSVAAPASGTRLSLIPSTFDLQSFDEMFRTSNERLQRWATRPRLVVIAAVMTYRANGGEEYWTTGERLSDEEVTQLVSHMTEGLALLTGGVYTEFAAVDIERPGADTLVNVGRSGRIVVGRYDGVVAFARTIGYGSWAEQADGTISAGSMFLDRDFDRNDARRRLLRIHELGHALGYRHVTARTSIMNPAIGPEPTDFDRAAAVLAFQRPIGNRSPDVDPASTPRTFTTTGEGARWTTVYCR